MKHIHTFESFLNESRTGVKIGDIVKIKTLNAGEIEGEVVDGPSLSTNGMALIALVDKTPVAAVLQKDGTWQEPKLSWMNVIHYKNKPVEQYK